MTNSFFTYAIIALCVILYLWQGKEEQKLIAEHGPIAEEVLIPPMQQYLLFDYPKAFEKWESEVAHYPLQDYQDVKNLPPEGRALLEEAESLPYWKGVFEMIIEGRTRGFAYVGSIPLFEKIRQGEVWRAITPCLLHFNFLHILFNMLWVWVLAKQIEVRLTPWRMFLLLVIIGLLSNIAQYVMSGPFFLGFSGIVVGMVGFIWMRQKKAPWEGYPLHPTTILFILVFVAAMFLLELGTFGLKLFSVFNISANIANTAHIVGGVVGVLLGKLSFFARRQVRT